MYLCTELGSCAVLFSLALITFRQMHANEM